ncbi:MAG TPA: Rne/Rng family ribonuclease [Terriglobales bacterium]|nr:Rne/Rng family ribonuclease [Terriglobales bacterium]
MTKEMYVSSTPHETKVAVVEDDQLAEIFFERENEYTLAGSIYKGRVTRVLPGMQSAFVDIGLERDAFLYVSDFLDLGEEDEEFDAVPTRPETYVTNKPQPEPRHYEFQKEFQVPEPPRSQAPRPVMQEPADGAYSELDTGADSAELDSENARGGFRSRRRRRGRRGRGFPESKFDRGPQREDTRAELPIVEDFGPPAGYEPVLLPGESISKYRKPESNIPDLDADTDVAESGAEDDQFGESGVGDFSTGSDAASFVIEGGFDSPDIETRFAEPEGVPASELAKEALKVPEADTPRPVPASVPTPFVLPGESIAKYNKTAKKEEIEQQVAEKADEVHVSELAPPPAPELPPVTGTTAGRETTGFSYRGPIVLPGEKIAKYQPKDEVETAPKPGLLEESADETTASAELQATGEQPPVTEQLTTISAESEEQSSSPCIDSDENASQGQAVEQLTEEVGSERKRKRQEGPRTEVRMERRTPVAPFILPGESIAKYRRISEAAAEPAASTLEEQAASIVSENEPLSVTLDRQLEGDVSQSSEQDAASDVEPEISVGEHGAIGGTVPAEPGTETNYEEMNVAATFGGEATQSPEDTATAAEAGEQSESSADSEAEAESAKYEQMNVASTFGGEAIETEGQQAVEAETVAAEDASTEAPEVDVENENTSAEGEWPEMPARSYDTVEERHGYSAGAGHTLEHEEIEEDESEYEPLAEEEDDSDFVEMEEQTLHATDEPHVRGIVGGDFEEANGLTDAVEDALLDHETAASAYPEDAVVEDNGIEIETTGELDDDEFEESELEADVVDDEAAPGTAHEAHATAGSYPQHPMRPGYDRRPGRGRRGGRRIRGGPRREAPRPIPQISDLLKEGQEVLIQIAKEPIGKKGARITSHIALPGRYLVYMPTVNHIGVSRKINSDEERQRLKRIMLSEREGGHGGFIVRTAAEGITEEELRADIRFLKNLWHDIKTRSENSKAPALIYHDLNLVERVLRDQVTADFAAIWVDNEAEYERVLRFAQRFQPQLVRKVKLYTKNTPLYDQFGIQEEINKALKSKVWLKSGGYIVINQTEALVAIDVNTGKYVGKTTRLEDTIVKTNIDAIREIVRQVRLRDLGGIIVIDFIDMDERKNRQKVMQALEEAMKADRAPSKVLAFNDFGLVAITRKRVKQSLERTLGEPCSYCTGTGLVKSLHTMCNEIYVEMRKMASHLEREDVILRVNPELAKALKANGGKWIQEMEELTRRTILVKSDPLLHQENFDIQG